MALLRLPQHPWPVQQERHLPLPRSYSFVNNGGSGYDYESMDVTYVSTDGFASGSSVHTWKKDGSDIGALLLNSTSYIDIGSPIEDIFFAWVLFLCAQDELCCRYGDD